MRQVQISNFSVGGNQRFTLIAGPCVIESEDLIFSVAEELKRITDDLGIHFIFKSSFDKANRSSISSPRGVGIEQGLRILQRVKETYNLPILTDVHESWQCAIVAEVADVLQIPAFLSRQTDLLMAAAQTGRVVNIKKGQFMAPWDMKQVIAKCVDAGNDQLLLCERGTSFGYNNLVVDMRGLVDMRSYGYPVVFDATHSVQKPSINGTTTGGDRRYVPYLMNAALSIGVDAIFAEVHPCPEKAWSDAANQLKLSDVRPILTHAIAVDSLTKNL